MYGSFPRKGTVQIIKFVLKNALCLNRCNFRTVHAIDFLFSTLHTTPFQYVNVYFGILHKLRADVRRPDSPWGSKMPHFQVGASKSLVCTQRGPVAIEVFFSLIFTLSVTEIYLCKVNAHFQLDSHNYCMQPAFHSPNSQYISITFFVLPILHPYSA